MPAASTRHIEPLLPSGSANPAIVFNSSLQRRTLRGLPRNRTRFPVGPIGPRPAAGLPLRFRSSLGPAFRPNNPDAFRGSTAGPILSFIQITQRRVQRSVRLVRGHQGRTVAPPTQVAPPFPFVDIKQTRAFRGMPVRRGKYSAPVPPQFNPPYPHAVIHQARAQRGWLLRRGKQAFPTQPQGAPVDEQRQRRAQRGWLFRRGQYRSPVPPQFNPPYPFAEVKQSRAQRGWLFRRGKHIFPTPPQAPPPNPAIVFNPTQRRTFRGMQPVKRWPIETVPPQFNPPYPFSEVKQTRSQRGWLRIRPRQQMPVQPQAAPVDPEVQPRRQRGLLLRRGRQWFPTPPQAPTPNPPITFNPTQRRAVRGWPVRRGKYRTPTPPQFNPPYPFAVIRQRTQRTWLGRRGKQSAPTPNQSTPITQRRPARPITRRLGRIVSVFQSVLVAASRGLAGTVNPAEHAGKVRPSSPSAMSSPAEMGGEVSPSSKAGLVGPQELDGL